MQLVLSWQQKFGSKPKGIFRRNLLGLRNNRELDGSPGKGNAAACQNKSAGVDGSRSHRHAWIPKNQLNGKLNAESMIRSKPTLRRVRVGRSMACEGVTNKDTSVTFTSICNAHYLGTSGSKTTAGFFVFVPFKKLASFPFSLYLMRFNVLNRSYYIRTPSFGACYSSTWSLSFQCLVPHTKNRTGSPS